MLDQIHEFNIDRRKRTLYCLYESIDGAAANQFLKNLDYLNRTKGRIRVYFSTSGGSVIDGLTMYEAIRRSANPVDIIITGAVQSIGAFIIQAAHRRLIEPTAYIMYHSGTFQTSETAVDEVAKEALFTRDQFSMIDSLMYARIKPKMSLDAFREAVRRSIWLDARQALKAGYVDEVLK
jgi:ATP-dependent Clp protease protease subunit